MQLDLFPLDTVLFPGATMPLRIFEPRYLDMIQRCGMVSAKEVRNGNAQ